MQPLSERMQQAFEYRKGISNSPRKVSKAALAKFCKIKPPSVSGWFDGKTKALSGDVLLNAAKYLNVSVEWLATGSGAMMESEGVAKRLNDATLSPIQQATVDALTKALIANRVSDKECLNLMQLWIS